MPEDALEFVDSAEQEMKKLGELVESFLTLTRVRDGVGSSVKKEVPANEAIMDAVEDSLSMASEYGVRIEPTLADGIDGGMGSVRGDPMLLRTMISNLIRNAVRFSPEDGVVRVIGSEVPGRFEIMVRDQGAGIDPDVLDHVFERHSQSADELRKKRGHGLGLSIARGIAEMHGGDIGVRNLPDGGAEFKIWVPVAYEAGGEGFSEHGEEQPEGQ